MSGIGPDGPPRSTCLQQIEAIVDSERSATEKLCAIKIRLRVDAKTLGSAFPSIATLSRAASVKDPRTIQAALDSLCGYDEETERDSAGALLIRERRPGRSTVFGFERHQLEAIVEEWATKQKAKNRRSPPSSHVGGQSDQPPALNAGGYSPPPSSHVGGKGGEPPSFHAAKGPEPPSPDVPLSGSTIRTHPPEGPREGEREIGPGLFLNCHSIRHPDFSISIEAVQLAVAGKGLPKESVITAVTAQAQQWATQIHNGKRADLILPKNILAAIAASIINQANREAENQVRLGKANGGGGKRTFSR